MRTEQPQHNCHEKQNDCGYIAKERNRYFTGKYMTARDFADEQSYFLSRHRLHNRLLHGWGIVCGLKVMPHPAPACAANWVVIQSGIALDCCGRELIIECETAYELEFPKEKPGGIGVSHPETDSADQYSKGAGVSQSDSAEEYSEPGAIDRHKKQADEFLLVIRYAEEEVEFVPALYSEGQCDPARKEANRIREKAVFELIRRDELDGNCWLNIEGDPKARCRDDCGENLPGPGGSCLEPHCPCGHAVPLALITRTSDGKFKIGMKGRRYLPTPPEFLTHIVDTNWIHGSEVTLEEINEKWNGRLEVRFDRKLLPPDGDRTGIGPFTFVVQYGGVQQAMEFLPYEGEYPPTMEEDCLAVFTIDPDYINTRRDRRNKTIVDNFVYVTLKCNYILDCHNNPVDGDFRRACFPTGDGVPGGVFESWFRVIHESEYKGRDEEPPKAEYDDEPKDPYKDRPKPRSKNRKDRDEDREEE